MDVNDRIYIPPPGAKKRMRGDRWVTLLLAIGAVFWLCMWLTLR
jgi:hypothetical protein